MGRPIRYATLNQDSVRGLYQPLAHKGAYYMTRLANLRQSTYFPLILGYLTGVWE